MNCFRAVEDDEKELRNGKITFRKVLLCVLNWIASRYKWRDKNLNWYNILNILIAGLPFEWTAYGD